MPFNFFVRVCFFAVHFVLDRCTFRLISLGTFRFGDYNRPALKKLHYNNLIFFEENEFQYSKFLKKLHY